MIFWEFHKILIFICIFLIRVKVDLTKYIESHKFNMDYAFGEECSNQ
jgi:hypothetical protein